MASRWAAWLFVVLSGLAAAQPEPVPPSPMELLTQGDRAMSTGQYAAAFAAYSQLLTVESTPRNLLKRAQVSILQQHYSKALKDLRKAVAQDPKYVAAQVYLGKVFHRTGACVDAEAAYERALALRPKHKDANRDLPLVKQCAALTRQLDAAFAANDCHRVHTTTEALAEIAPSFSHMHWLDAQCAFRQQDWQNVIVRTGQLLKSNTQHSGALKLRGIANYRTGEYEHALQHFKIGLRSDPENKEISKYFKMVKKLVRFMANAAAELEAGQFVDAAGSFERASLVDVSNAPHNHELQVKQLDALVKAGEPQAAAAIALADELVARDTQRAELYYFRGEAKLHLSLYEAAQADMRHALELNRNDRRFHDGYQRAEFEAKKAARKDYYKILEVEKSATQKEIKRKFRRLARDYHPDKVSRSASPEEIASKEDHFKELVEAYELLTDEDLRGRYDRGEDVTPGPGQNQQQQRGGGFPFGGGFPGHGGGGGGGFSFRYGG